MDSTEGPGCVRTARFREWKRKGNETPVVIAAPMDSSLAEESQLRLPWWHELRRARGEGSSASRR